MNKVAVNRKLAREKLKKEKEENNLSQDLSLYPVDDLFKHNDFIKMLQVKKQMNIHQQKIFDSVLSTVQEMKRKGRIQEIIEEGELNLEYDIFIGHIMKGSRIKKINNKDLQKAMEDLVGIKFSWSTEDEVGAVVLFQKGVIDIKNKKVKVVFGKDFRTNSLIPTSNYTALSYEYLNKFKSQYARAMYQYFKMLIGKNSLKPFRTDITLDLDFLRNLLGITKDEHKEYFNNIASFTKRCIEPAKKEINLYADITCDYKTIKAGRVIKYFKFEFHPKANSIIEIEEETIKSKNEDIFKKYNINSGNQHTNSNLTLDVNIKAPKDFNQFRQYVKDNYLDKDLGNMVKGFENSIIFSLDITGYIKIKKSGKIITKEESLVVWKYFFKNQNKLGEIQNTENISNVEKLEIFIGREMKVKDINSDDDMELKTLVITGFVSNKVSGNKFKVILKDLNLNEEKPSKKEYTYDEIASFSFSN